MTMRYCCPDCRSQSWRYRPRKANYECKKCGETFERRFDKQRGELECESC